MRTKITEYKNKQKQEKKTNKIYITCFERDCRKEEDVSETKQKKSKINEVIEKK